MEYIGYVLLCIVLVCWLGAMIVGFVVAFPVGLVGLAAIGGVGLLLAAALRDRLRNQEDDYYDKNVEK